MPELPDITVYCEALGRRVVGEPIERIAISSPFVLRSVDPPIGEAEGRRVLGVCRMGKRIVLALEGDLYLIFHLMIAGRLRWRAQVTVGRQVLANIGFPDGTLVFTEAGTKKRASIFLVRGEAALRAHDRGGLEVFEADVEAFARALARENHTLKRALTDPTIFSGIGNAYSDEILHAAKLSPMALTQSLGAEKVERLFEATRKTLAEWTERLRNEVGDGFPEEVTAFREGMAVHGKHTQPCPVCGTAVQRIAYAENECNYCPRCQTDGKLLADRALSRLMHDDWPKTIAELEERGRIADT